MEDPQHDLSAAIALQITQSVIWEKTRLGNLDSAALHPRSRADHQFLSSKLAQALCLVLLIGIGVLRIVSTYRVFSHTIDEPAHIACGMQWLQHGTYTYESLHPPISRISVALGPYLAGVRGYGDASMWQEGLKILSTGGHYWRNLTLARIGILPYFALATCLLFAWTRRLYGTPAALIAAGVFTFLPVVLAHSSVATTDIPFTAMFLSSLFTFVRWLRNATKQNAIVFGICTGLAVATKFSALVFLPATMLSIAAAYLTAGKRNLRSLLKSAALALLFSALTVWAAYRFSHAPLAQVTSVPVRAATKIFGRSSRTTHAAISIAEHLPVPAPEFFDGIRSLRDQNRTGRRAYMFGRMRIGGWWYFYIVSIALKTPLAVLLLAMIGALHLMQGWRITRDDWERVTPVLACIALLVVTAPSRINIGVRHILPIFVFISMLAAIGAVTLWNSQTIMRVLRMQRDPRARLSIERSLVLLLLIWFASSSLQAHPDYLAYFNELGGNTPAQRLVISDLDWGQDLERLSIYFQKQGVQRFSYAYEGVFTPEPLGLPTAVKLQCGVPATGWIAIEERRARVYPECYQWLDGVPLKAEVGASERVYFIPNSAASH